MSQCSICKKTLDVQGDFLSLDCGGDCIECMAVAGDTDIIKNFAQAYQKLGEVYNVMVEQDNSRDKTHPWIPGFDAQKLKPEIHRILFGEEGNGLPRT